MNRPRYDRGLLWQCQTQKFSGLPIFYCIFFCSYWINLRGHIYHSASGMFVNKLQLLKVGCFIMVLMGPINRGFIPSLETFLFVENMAASCVCLVAVYMW